MWGHGQHSHPFNEIPSVAMVHRRLSRGRGLPRFLDTLKYREDQPRDELGRWIYDGGRRPRARKPEGRVQLAQNIPRGGRGSGLSGVRWPDATLPQQARLTAAEVEAQAAIRRVQEIDPNWRPTPRLLRPTSAEDEINGLEGIREDAEARLADLGRQSPETLIGAYRARYNERDLFGRDTWSSWKGTVAVGRIDEMPVFGVNSRAPGYTDIDQSRADRMRDELVRDYSHVMNTDNVGHIPNDALYHAEATFLLRAAGQNRGTLAGRDIEVTVDRPMCESCSTVLPYLGLRLGNPRVTFIDLGGVRRTMQNGSWEK
jgi:hypothetical protein